MTDDVAAQRQFHRTLFSALFAWPQTHAAIVDFTGEDGVGGIIGLDQLGHFGPHSCLLVAEVIAERCGGRPLVLELGSGFGGARRDIAARLRTLGLPPAAVVGCDLVLAHCQLAADIDDSLGASGPRPLCADVARLPVHSGSVDVVCATGSASHFADMRAVLAEAHRVLADDGVLVFTEEVSLLTVRPERLSAAFRRCHPVDVFRFSTEEARLAELRAAGFRSIELRDLTEWAVDLLRDRLRALRLFRGSAEQIFGATETEMLTAQLASARDEMVAGHVRPALIIARPS